MSTSVVIFLIIIVIIITIVLITQLRKPKPLSKTKTSLYILEKIHETILNDLPGLNIANGAIDSYIMRLIGTKDDDDFEEKHVCTFNKDDCINIELPNETQYYEISFCSIDTGRLIYTIPYLESTTLNIGTDLPISKYIIIVRALKGTVLQESWKTTPVLKFVDRTQSSLKRVHDYVPKTDEMLYESIGQEFIKLDKKYKDDFIVSFHSKTLDFKSQSSMISQEIMALDLKSDEYLIVIIPKRSITMSEHVVSSLQINGEIVDIDTKENLYIIKIVGKIHPKVLITETILGVHNQSITVLDYYGYKFKVK
jgi:hypothetical protein